MAAPILAPSSPLTIRRDLHDGAMYELATAAPGVITLAIRDADDDVASIAFDRAAARQLVEDAELVAGLRPKPATVGRAAALAGSIRIVFEQLRELDKTEPAEVDVLLAAIVGHVRSWRPVALLAGGAP